MGPVSKRLRWAVDRQPAEGRSRGVGLLLRKLRARGVRGATYPSMISYLRGKAEPSVDLLRAVAEVTDVSVRWLVLGEGSPAKEARVARAKLGRATSEAVEALEFQAEVWRALGFMPLRLPERPGAEATAAEVTAYESTIAVHAANLSPWLPALAVAQHQLDVNSKAIAQALTAPLEALHIQLQEAPPGALNEYVFVMLPVLFALARAREEQPAAQPKAQPSQKRKRARKKATKRTRRTPKNRRTR